MGPPYRADGRIRNNSVSGLGLRVTALGRKAFIHAYNFNGERCRKVIGSTISYNVASARLEVIKRKQELDGGKNPDADRMDPRRKHFLTIREAIDRYWVSHLSTLSEGYKASFGLFMAKWLRQAPKRVSRRGHNVRKGHTDFGTMFAKRSLYSIKPLDIEDYLKQFSSTHSHNYALRHVLAFFNWAIRMQLVDMRNPCTPIRVRKATDSSRPRNNFRKGLDRFKALGGVPNHFQLYDLKRIAISLMLTGQGVSRETLSHYVDHKGNISTTAIYDLGLVDPMRPVTEKLGSLLGL